LSRPYVTLVLPAYNEALRIAQTVGEAQTYFEQRGHSYEIIVSAEGNDGTRRTCSSHGRVLIPD